MDLISANSYRYFFLLFVLFFLGSCTKDKLDSEKSVLSGNWRWVHTQHSFNWCSGNPSYEIFNPDLVGRTHSISFLQKGKVIFYKNGVKDGKYRINVEQFSELSESLYAFQLKLDNNDKKVIEGLVSQDTLNIKYPYIEDDPNCESYLNVFVRE